MQLIELPSIYTREVWERGGSTPSHEKFIGKPYISWSQVETFNDKVGFNSGLLGEYEWCLKYLSKKSFPDLGWGTFGHEVEGYITEKTHGDKFTERERAVLDKIKPLGDFQREIVYHVKSLDVVVLGYIDDMTPPKGMVVKLLRDYKTKSESSKKDLHLPKKYQIEIYTKYLIQEGYTVEAAEYCVIERLGGAECMKGGGREVLSVGDRVWYEPYKITEKRLQETDALLVETVLKMDKYYRTFKKYFSPS